MEALFQFLRSFHPLPEELVDYLRQVVKKKEVYKRHFVCRPGQICQHIYFIEKGLFRCYYSRDNRDISSGFMLEGDVCISVESFFGQQKSEESIQALENSLVYFISYEELQDLYRRFPVLNIIGRLLMEKYYRLSRHQSFIMQVCKAEERYHWLVSHSPELIFRVRLKHIASYLGISDVMLSKIRGKW